jgi:hypothetical protein
VKIGDYVTVQEIASQCEARWVVLTNWKYRNYDGYEDVEGGIVRYIANTKREAGKAALELEHDGTDAFIVCGALEPLCVGGVFVE